MLRNGLDYQSPRDKRRWPRYRVVSTAMWVVVALTVVLNALLLALSFRTRPRDPYVDMALFILLVPAGNVLLALVAAAFAPAIKHWSAGVSVKEYVRWSILLPLLALVVTEAILLFTR